MEKRKKRPKRLLRLKIIMLFGAALFFVFILLFHKEDRFRSMFEMVQPDRISVLYLQLLVNMDPTNTALRLALARQHAKIGEIAKARLALEPLMNQHGQEATEGKLLSLEMDINNYFSMTSADNSKQKVLAELKRKIASIANEQMPVSLLPAVIQRSLELEKPELAAKLYERWASIDSEHYYEKIQVAGRWYVAAGMPMTAAEKYKAACVSTSDRKQAREFALLTIKAMQAADKTLLALAFVKEYLLRYPNDVSLLDEAVKLSLASNDQKQALSWGKLRLALNPDNPEQINKQIDLALASGDLDVAWSLSEQLLARKPKDIQIRKRSAQIAEWSRRQAAALDQWAWIANQNNVDEMAVQNALRLADGLKAGNITIAILTRLAERRKYSEAEYNCLVNAAINSVSSDSAIALMQNYLTRYPSERKAWETLAIVQENAKQLKQALSTWNHVSARFGQPLIAIIHQADLLRRTGQLQLAYSNLLLNQKRASSDNADFWRLYGDISWEGKHAENALFAYRTLCESDPADMLAAERLIQLLRDKAQGREAVAIAHKAYQRFDQPRWILLAMDSAIQFKLWDELRRLMQITDADREQYERLEMYWLIRAQFNIHNKNPRQALADYRQAHNINPASKIAKEGELWTLIDLQNQVVSRISTASRLFSSTLASECVYDTGFRGSICAKE